MIYINTRGLIDRIDIEIKKRGNAKELAEKIGVPYDTLYRLRVGKGVQYVPVLKVLYYLEISLSEYITSQGRLPLYLPEVRRPKR